MNFLLYFQSYHHCDAALPGVKGISKELIRMWKSMFTAMPTGKTCDDIDRVSSAHLF